MCDCLKKSENKIINHLNKQLKENGINVKEVNTVDSGYSHKGLTFGEGNGGWKLGLPFEFKYIPIKKDGTSGKEVTKKINIFPAFCPFCGEKQND